MAISSSGSYWTTAGQPIIMTAAKMTKTKAFFIFFNKLAGYKNYYKQIIKLYAKFLQFSRIPSIISYIDFRLI